MMSDILPQDDIYFDGSPASGGIDKFIRSIRRAALAQGKSDDDRWCAAFAAASLEGQALVYYERLNDETQASWRQLRQALLDRYRVTEPSYMSPGPPMPAAAAGPNIAAMVSPLQQLSLEPWGQASPAAPSANPNTNTNEGYIRVVDLRGLTLGYVSTTVHSNGVAHIVSRDFSIALRVQKMKPEGQSASGFFEFKALNGPNKGNYVYAKWAIQAVNIGVGSGDAASITTSPNDVGTRNGRAQSCIWRVCADGTLDAFWTRGDGARYLLESGWDPSDGETGLMGDFKAISAKYPVWHQARLVLELAA